MLPFGSSLFLLCPFSDIHLGIASDFGIVAAAVDIVADIDAKDGVFLECTPEPTLL
jgi:hypothetical protein